jgi:hypothetical protein
MISEDQEKLKASTIKGHELVKLQPSPEAKRLTIDVV